MDILDEVSPNRPWEHYGKTDQMIIKAMRKYANLKLDEAADKAKIKGIPNMGGYLKMVDRESILNLKDNYNELT